MKEETFILLEKIFIILGASLFAFIIAFLIFAGTDIERAARPSNECIFLNENIQAPHELERVWTVNGELRIPDVNLVQPTGASMQPRFFQGNTVVFRDWNVEGERLKEGDIVFYRDGKKTTIHTVIAVYSDYIIAKGDNVSKCEHVDLNQVFAKAIGIIFT